MHILSNCTANIWEPILLIYLPKKQHTQPPGMSPTISQNLQMLILYLNIFWGSYHYRTQQTMIFFLMNNTHSVNRLKTLTREKPTLSIYPPTETAYAISGRCYHFPNLQIPKGRAAKDGSRWLNIRIIRIRICLKCKYEYPYSYSILIWMSYGCIRIRLWELFSIQFHIRIRGISDHIRIRPYPQRKSD